MAGGFIICGGRDIPCDAPVKTWRYNPKLSFPRLRMRTETRMVTWHWTGGRGLAEQVHRTLTERGLSCHFLIEPLGDVFQFCDAQVRAAHAGSANAYSVGVEMTNAATSTPELGRTLLRESIHGVEFTYTSFTSEQVKSALALADALERAYDLPRAVPMAGADVVSGVMTAAQLAKFKGHVPHYVLNAAKRDCGMMLMRALAAQPMRGRDGSAE